MTIEQQGYVEVQPPYQHVGYAAAAWQGDYLVKPVASPGLGLLGLGMVFLAAGLMLLRTRKARPLVPTLLAAGALSAMVGSFCHAARPQRLTPEALATLVHIEEACALTEGWVEELGEPPTADQWEDRMVGHSCRLDGWGNPLRYIRLPGPSERDGQAYAIAGGAKPEEPDDHAFTFCLASWHFGPDGLVGTPDDVGSVVRAGATRLVETGRYKHGRTRRETAR